MDFTISEQKEKKLQPPEPKWIENESREMDGKLLEFPDYPEDNCMKRS